MDLATAKTLVSALTVLAIVVFSLVSFEMAFKAIAGDLKAVRAKRAAEAESADKAAGRGVTPSAAS